MQLLKKILFIAMPLVLIGLLLAVAAAIRSNGRPRFATVSSERQNPFTRQPDPNQPPLLLKSIGVELGAFDPATGRAGDFEFTKQKLQFDRLWMDYAFPIPASSMGPAKRNPQPAYILPLGTKIRSLVDGVVINIPTLYSNDYSIQVGKDKNSNWLYETEHVINPIVKVGDTVKAGQTIAEVSNYSDGLTQIGMGMTEISILKGGNPPQHVCPFLYLDPSIKDTVTKQIRDFYTAWESYKGDSTLYNETIEPTGCLTTEVIDG